MRKIPIIFVIALFLQVCQTKGQSLERSVIGAAGHSLGNENIALSFTLGETAVATINDPNLIVTEGFQQSEIQGLTGIDEIIFINGLQVYPNPTTDLLNLGIPVEDPFEISAALYDMLGKKIFASDQLELVGRQYQLDLTGLPAGLYLLVVGLDNSEVTRTYKVEKIQ